MTTNTEKIFWIPEANAVVVRMNHTEMYDNEPDASIKSFDSPQEARQFERELQDLHGLNQMGLVKSHQYHLFGIERGEVDGVACIAKTASPFDARITRIEDEKRKLNEKFTNDSTNAENNRRMAALESELAALKHAQQVSAGDPNAIAVAKAEAIERDQVEKDIAATKKTAAKPEADIKTTTVKKKRGRPPKKKVDDESGQSPSFE